MKVEKGVLRASLSAIDKALEGCLSERVGNEVMEGALRFSASAMDKALEECLPK
jgi:hypothetical protein